MAGTRNGDGGRGRQGARRARQQTGRPHRVQFGLTDAELAVLEEAAARAGLSKGAYAALAVMAVAGGDPGSPLSESREALRELVRATGVAGKIGGNLNQAVAWQHATGRPAGQLPALARECTRRVEHVGDAAERVARTIR